MTILVPTGENVNLSSLLAKIQAIIHGQQVTQI